MITVNTTAPTVKPPTTTTPPRLSNLRKRSVSAEGTRCILRSGTEEPVARGREKGKESGQGEGEREGGREPRSKERKEGIPEG